MTSIIITNLRIKALLFVATTCCLISSSSLALTSESVSNSVSDSASTSTSTSITLSNETFVQNFRVGNGLVFDDNEIELFQFLIETYTSKFIVANNYTSLCPDLFLAGRETEQESIDQLINDAVVSKCTVQSQKQEEEKIDDVDVESTTTSNNIVDDNTATADGADNDADFVNVVRYVVSYESSICNNVVNYPLFFQYYVNQNLDTMMNELLLFNMDIINIEMSKRAVQRNNNSTN